MAEEKLLKLTVAEAVQDDVGRGIVRIDAASMRELDVGPGDFVEIVGKDSTVAIVDRAYPADVGMNIIRMDGVIRWNSKSSIGEPVEVKLAKINKATGVVLAPARKGVYVQVNPQAVKSSLIGRAVLKGDIVSLGGTHRRRMTMSGSPFEDIFRMLEQDFTPFGFVEMKFVVVDVKPSGPAVISELTEVELRPEAVELKKDRIPDITYEDIGGLRGEVMKVRELIEIPMKHPELFQKLGIEPPKGVLLYGPPGCGKTLLAKAVANESNLYFKSINGPEVMSKWVGEAEKTLRKIFEDAEKNAPSIIFIDEIDAIAPKREEAVGEVERRVVAQILSLMDGLKSRGRVIVIAATNRLNAIDPALRRPGRFDREIEIGVPDRNGRETILKIHTRNMPLVADVDLKYLASITHGFVGADLEALCKEAAMSVLRKLIPEINVKEEGPLPEQLLQKIKVTKTNFEEALKNVVPSAMREVLIETPQIKWSDIGGLDYVKQVIKEAVEWPLKYSDAFSQMGIKPSRGILLYGPPGCGKTMLAKAIANESEANFISVKGPAVFSKWVGESEKSIRELFRKARQVSPAIIFFYEIDAIAPKRGYDAGTRVTEQVVNQLLVEMDGLEDLKDVVVIAGTNRPDIIDTALLRPGRFDKMVYIPPPDVKAREQIFKVHMKKMPLEEDVSVESLAEKTDGFSGADIEAVCREAAMSALRKDIDSKKLKNSHFLNAIKKIGPSLDKKELRWYEEFIERNKPTKATMPLAQEVSYVG